MNAQMFLENFGPIANAPGGVKRLREMILHYAVSGKLVAQIDSDGNAEQDIEKANFLREEFQQRFKIRNRKPIESPRNEEIPFSIPKNWKWTRMESIACYIQRGKGPMYAASGQALVVSQKCIQWSGFDLTPARRISDESLRQYGEERFLIKGDILWNSTGTGTAGRVAIYPGSQEPAVADSHVTIIRLANFIPQYVWCYLASPIIQARMAPNQESSMVSGTTNQVELSTSKVVELPVPCPPIEEQKRIVAKVDELMALCDKLETQQQERERRFPVLSRACHARFMEAPSLDNLRAIFDEAGSVSTEDLRKTILDLAVQGRLISRTAQPDIQPLGSLLENASLNGVSKSPTQDQSATQVLKISAGTSRGDFFVDESDYKYVNLEPDEIAKFQLIPGDLLACRYNGNLHFVGRFSLYRGVAGRIQVNPDKLIRFRIDKKLYYPRYICYAMNAPSTRILIESMCATTAGNIGLSAGKIKKIVIPVPLLSEQRKIAAKVDQLMALIDKLEEQQARKAKVAQAFAQAAVSAITGTVIKEPEKMKAPKTELVSRLQTRNTPNAADPAPLAKLLTDHNGELPTKALWQQSGLDIDAFYQQLRTEMAQGWIVEPEKAVMKEIATD